MSISARGNREHWQPNYTSKKKIKAFSHDGACWRSSNTTSCASKISVAAEKNLRAAILLRALRDSRRLQRSTDKIWTFDTRDLCATTAADTFCTQLRAQESSSLRRTKCAVNA